MSTIGNHIREPYRGFRKCRILLENMLSVLPYFRFFRATRSHETPITFRVWFHQKFVGVNGAAYWPMHKSSLISYSQNVLIGVDTNPGYNPGCYIHAFNGVFIGDYTFIGPNVGLMSANHDLADLRVQRKGEPIRIGRYCWLGMGAVVLPEVTLGDYTIVGAGAIVTRSFPDGYCVIAGNPAKVIRQLSPDECTRFETGLDYIGYIPKKHFERFRKQYLAV